MCAVSGWIDYKKSLLNQKEIADKMAQTMVCRGPDEGAFAFFDEALLIHRRLAVIDVENGKQPMSFFDYTLIYNGELYNTNELRQELTNLGHTFYERSDTEVLLHAFAEWGEECAKKLNGIFAFAVWNKKTKTLYLFRDRIGVKPLFYYRYEKGIIFASEIKTLLAHPCCKPIVNKDGLKEVFLIGPGRTPGRTAFKGIEELLPGELAIFNTDGFHRRLYWKLEAKEHTDSVSQTIEKTRYLISNSIQRQLVSDVELCCFLSGGLDSSIITAVASNKMNCEGKRLSTYSVDYSDNDRFFKSNAFQPNSDGYFIDIMQKFTNSDHHSVVLDNTALFNALDNAVNARDLPGMADIDSSLLLFCNEIKKTHTVGLSGECADELFGGYPWYHRSEILFEECFPWSRSAKIRQFILRDGLLDNAEEYLHERYQSTVDSTPLLDGEQLIDKRMRQMFVANFKWFMQTLLDRKDRMSMYNGLEVRVPFCDYRIAEYAFNMPWSIKALGGREKGIVREAFKNLLPAEIVERKKSPYPKTFNPIYMEHAKKAVMKILDEKSPLQEMLNRKNIELIMNNPEDISEPWYGQLMRAPQMLAYIYQISVWIDKYNVQFE